MTSFPEDQVAELRQLCPGLQSAPEGDNILYSLPKLSLHEGCTPAAVDALLCPFEREGYPFRLYFAELIAAPVKLNWNTTGCRILERNWFAFSWKVPGDLRLIQMVAALLRVMVP